MDLREDAHKRRSCNAQPSNCFSVRRTLVGCNSLFGRENGRSGRRCPLPGPGRSPFAPSRAAGHRNRAHCGAASSPHTRRTAHATQRPKRHTRGTTCATRLRLASPRPRTVNRSQGRCLWLETASPFSRNPLSWRTTIRRVGEILAIVDRERAVEADLVGIFAQEPRANAVEGARPGQCIGHDGGTLARHLRRNTLHPAGHFGHGDSWRRAGSTRARHLFLPIDRRTNNTV